MCPVNLTTKPVDALRCSFPHEIKAAVKNGKHDRGIVGSRYRISMPCCLRMSCLRVTCFHPYNNQSQLMCSDFQGVKAAHDGGASITLLSRSCNLDCAETCDHILVHYYQPERRLKPSDVGLSTHRLLAVSSQLAGQTVIQLAAYARSSIARCIPGWPICPLWLTGSGIVHHSCLVLGPPFCALWCKPAALLAQCSWYFAGDPACLTEGPDLHRTADLIRPYSHQQ